MTFPRFVVGIALPVVSAKAAEEEPIRAISAAKPAKGPLSEPIIILVSRDLLQSLVDVREGHDACPRRRSLIRRG